jgi:hypothetical protein
MKLGEAEGIKARLDKRLGSDELLKVDTFPERTEYRLFIVFFTNGQGHHMKSKRISESFLGFISLTTWISL